MLVSFGVIGPGDGYLSTRVGIDPRVVVLGIV